jgi:hypothetical protein
LNLETAVTELQAWKTAVLPSPPKPTTDRLDARRALHHLIHERLDPDDLRSLCYDLGIIYGDLGDGGHDDKIRELLLMVIRDGRSAALEKRLGEIRPGVAWPGVE